jgi:hypothetical protein
MKSHGKETLNLLLMEFPAMENKIIRRYHESSSFLEICEDYAVCLESMKRMESQHIQGFGEEYAMLSELLSDLKEELLNNLDL